MPNPTPIPELLPVEEVDRGAARRFNKVARDISWAKIEGSSLRHHRDTVELAEAFARHRQRALEEAAKVAEDIASSPNWTNLMQRAGKSIAAAIRSLSQ